MTKNQIEHILLYVLMVSALVTGAYFSIVKGQLAKLESINKEKSSIAVELDTAEKRTRSLPELQRNLRKLNETIDEMERSMIQKGDFSDFLELIKRAADKAGMKLKNVRPRMGALDIPWGDSYVERQVQIETSSRYHTIGKWLDNLENEAQFIRVVELKMFSSQDDTGIHPAEMTIGFLVKTK